MQEQMQAAAAVKTAAAAAAAAEKETNKETQQLQSTLKQRRTEEMRYDSPGVTEKFALIGTTKTMMMIIGEMEKTEII